AVPTAATAGGGGGFFIIETTGGGSGGHAVNSRLKVTGSVTVEFRGDEAAGCAAAHLCGVTGTVRWNPAGPGSVLAFGYREHGKRFEQGYLTFGDPSGEGQPIRTSARVRRTGVPGSLCADGAIRDAETGGAPRRGSSIEFRLLDLPGAAPAPSEV